MASIVSICLGSSGACTASVATTCAFCQDVNSRCAWCKPGYQCLGTKAKNSRCSANSAFKCPAAAGPNCISCSAPCAGTGLGMGGQCVAKWQPQWGCAECATGYKNQQTQIPIPGLAAGAVTACSTVNVTTCVKNNNIIG